MIRYVGKAEAYIKNKTKGKPLVSLPSKPVRTKDFASSGGSGVSGDTGRVRPSGSRWENASVLCGDPGWRQDEEGVLAREMKEICQSGVLTPDHIIWTKNRAVYIEDIPEEDIPLRQTVENV